MLFLLFADDCNADRAIADSPNILLRGDFEPSSKMIALIKATYYGCFYGLLSTIILTGDNMRYGALIIDMIYSRRYKKRFIVQELFNKAIMYLNDVFAPSIKKKQCLVP